MHERTGTKTAPIYKVLVHPPTVHSGFEMVKLHIKRGEESVFLYDTTAQVPIQDLIIQLVKLHNGILKVQRLCQG